MNNIVFFWSHRRGTHACFSQWYPRDFEVDGLTYCCMEQYMMHQKAVVFNDEVARDQIMLTTDPAKIKEWGRKVRNFNSEVWDFHKLQIVYQGNLAKFSQNEDLKSKLLDTGDSILAEASPYDRVWGIGLRSSDPRAANPEQWRGQNLLGSVLMQVRTTLRESA